MRKASSVSGLSVRQSESVILTCNAVFSGPALASPIWCCLVPSALWYECAAVRDLMPMEWSFEPLWMGRLWGALLVGLYLIECCNVTRDHCEVGEAWDLAVGEEGYHAREC